MNNQQKGTVNHMGQELAKKEGTETIGALLTRMKGQFAMALPKHITPDRFMRVALTAINKTPKLANCTRESLLACLMDCSALGIEPDGRLAYLIPYGDQCTLIVGYKGIVELARRSGEIADIHADIVCANDQFEYSFGSEGKLVHKPKLGDRGDVIAVYSFAKLKDGSASYEVMDRAEVDAIKNRSKASGNGPWKTDWNEMAKKTVFRRHSKWLPVSSEKMQEALEKDFDLPSDIVDMSRVGKPVVQEPKAIAATASSSDGLSEEEKRQAIEAENARPKKQLEPGDED